MGERGARPRAKAFNKPNWPNLDMIFCKKNLLLVATFRPKIKSNTTKFSKLKNTLKDENKIYLFLTFLAN